MREPVKNALKLLHSANQLSKEKAFNSLGVLIFFLMCCSVRNARKGMKRGKNVTGGDPSKRENQRL